MSVSSRVFFAAVAATIVSPRVSAAQTPDGGPRVEVFAPPSPSELKAPDGTPGCDHPYPVAIPAALFDEQGTVAVWFKTHRTLRMPGPVLELLESKGLQARIECRGGGLQVLIRLGSAMTGQREGGGRSSYAYRQLLTHLKADRWYHAAWSWDAQDARRNGFFLDGVRQGDPPAYEYPDQVQAANDEVAAKVGAEGLSVSGLSVYDQALGERELKALCKSAGHKRYTDEGVRFTGEKFIPADVDWTRPVYETSFDDHSVLADWRLEGGRRMSIADGKLILESDSGALRSETKANHLVCWLTREVPADFLLEFAVRPQNRERGLNIIFFNARGQGGENIFDPPIKPRNGLFRQYHSGDINNYHTSYWSGGRGTANLRKNKGFYLTAVGKDLVYTASADAFQTIRLYKRGGKIRLMVDDVVSLAYDDDGKTYGPLHRHSGWIGLRQMGHTRQCEYAYLRIYPLKQPPTAPQSTKYLEAVREFLDTLIEHGTDRYGPQHSPMFCSILDLKTRRMPDAAPPLLPEQRQQDRSYPGGNLAQDMLTLLTMYHLSGFTHDPKYAKAADDYLRFFLKHCPPVGNGLFPCGEHAFWNFRKETIGRDTHENLGLVPADFLDRLWQINPQAVEKHIRALRHHIVRKKQWYWNRHAWIIRPQKRSIRVVPRHGGFYLYEWVYLYSKCKDPEVLEWANKTAGVHWAHRHPVTGNISSFFPADKPKYNGPDKTACGPASTLSLGLSLLEANTLLGAEALPRFDRIGRTYAAQALKAGHDPKHGIVVQYVNADGTPFEGLLGGKKKNRTAGFWTSRCPVSGGYGLTGAERFAVMCMRAYRLLKSEDHLQFAKDVWDCYQTQTPPPGKKLWPGKFAGLIGLSLDLHDLTGEQKYLDYARQIADSSLEELFTSGLFRAATGADYYEAAMGPGALALELLRLHLTLTNQPYNLPRNYYDR